MRERGKVITVREGSVDVLMQPSAGCGGCTLCSRNEGGETVMHDVADALGSTVGDVVDVVIPDAVRSRAAFAVFLVPVVSLLAGYLAGSLLGPWAGLERETAGVVGALLSATIAMLGIRSAEHRLAGDAAFAPKVGAIISRDRSHM
jgi:positive regulator of sigma E activity